MQRNIINLLEQKKRIKVMSIENKKEKKTLKHVVAKWRDTYSLKFFLMKKYPF